jgi:hypothetical protein
MQRKLIRNSKLQKAFNHWCRKNDCPTQMGGYTMRYDYYETETGYGAICTVITVPSQLRDEYANTLKGISFPTYIQRNFDAFEYRFNGFWGDMKEVTDGE